MCGIRSPSAPSATQSGARDFLPAAGTERGERRGGNLSDDRKSGVLDDDAGNRSL